MAKKTIHDPLRFYLEVRARVDQLSAGKKGLELRSERINVVQHELFPLAGAPGTTDVHDNNDPGLVQVPRILEPRVELLDLLEDDACEVLVDVGPTDDAMAQELETGVEELRLHLGQFLVPCGHLLLTNVDFTRHAGQARITRQGHSVDLTGHAEEEGVFGVFLDGGVGRNVKRPFNG